MTARPITTRILDEVEARLKRITTANGYRRSLAGVRRATLTGFQSADLPMVNFWTGTDAIESRGAGFTTRRMALLVEAYDLTRDRPFVDVVNELAEDVTIALHRAGAAPKRTDSPEPTLSGLITSLQLETVTPQIGEGQAPWCGALLTFSALYKTRNDGVSPLHPPEPEPDPEDS